MLLLHVCFDTVCLRVLFCGLCMTFICVYVHVHVHVHVYVYVCVYVYVYAMFNLVWNM